MSVFLKNTYFSNKKDLPEVKISHHGKSFIAADWNYRNLNMPFWYLYWNETPGGTLIFDKQEINLTQDRLLLIPPHTTFSTLLKHSFQHFYIHFAAGGIFERVRRAPILLPSKPYLETLKLPVENDTFRTLQLYALICEALLRLPRECFAGESEQDMDPRIRQALALMENLEPDDSGNMKVCRKIGMSLSNFHRLFKQEIGISPKHYTRNLRLEKARYLLLFSALKISEIADHLGFADRYHFSKAFKTCFNITPAAFREENQENNLPTTPAGESSETFL